MNVVSKGEILVPEVLNSFQAFSDFYYFKNIKKGEEGILMSKRKKMCLYTHQCGRQSRGSNYDVLCRMSRS